MVKREFGWLTGGGEFKEIQRENRNNMLSHVFRQEMVKIQRIRKGTGSPFRKVSTSSINKTLGACFSFPQESLTCFYPNGFLLRYELNPGLFN